MRNLLAETMASEQFAIKILSEYFNVKPEDFLHVTAIDPDNPIDIVFTQLKYDVKFSNPTLTSRTKRKNVWDFDLRGKSDYCDYLILIGIKSFRPRKVFLVPAKDIPIHHIRISIDGVSKWHKYIIWQNQ